VNAPGRSDYDALVRVESQESKPDHFKLKVVLTVLDPAGKEAVVQYSREADLGDSIFDYVDSMKRAMGGSLSSIRTQMLAEQQGKGLRALVAAHRVIQVVRDQVQWAQAAEAQGDYATALRTLRQALTADPKSPAPVAAAVAFLHRLCDPEGAKRFGEAAQKAHPTDAALATALAGTGVTPHAPACEAQALNRDGVALARERKLPEALAKFQAARQRAPGLVPKASYNAALLLEAARPPEAVQAYLEATRGFLDPADQQEALTRLVATAQRARLPVPETADRRYRLGVVRVEQKRYPEAVTEFEAALAEAPWLVDAYYNLGLVYDFTGATANALQALRAYVQLAPQAANLGAVKTKIVELEDKLGVLPPAGK
jgi:tetratricopeptide (TPR) repeat protein